MNETLIQSADRHGEAKRQVESKSRFKKFELTQQNADQQENLRLSAQAKALLENSYGLTEENLEHHSNKELKEIAQKCGEIQANINDAISTAKRITGIDTSNARIVNLEGGIAGRYHIPSGGIEIDEKVARSKEIEKTLVHEAAHAEAFANSKQDAPIVDPLIRKAYEKLKLNDSTLPTTSTDAHEALTEMYASEKLGKSPDSYESEIASEPAKLQEASRKLFGRALSDASLIETNRKGHFGLISFLNSFSDLSEAEKKAHSTLFSDKAANDDKEPFNFPRSFN